jgi:thiol:disulfide interchange protein
VLILAPRLARNGPLAAVLRLSNHQEILSFVQQAGERRRQALMLNLWHSLGLLSVFLVLGSQGEDELPWRPFSRQTFDELIAAQNTVMVDFTADWCMTCKTLEKLVLNTSRTDSAVRRNGVVALRADWTHASPEVTESNWR